MLYLPRDSYPAVPPLLAAAPACGDGTRWDDWFAVTQAVDSARVAERRLTQTDLAREAEQVERLIASLQRTKALISG